MVRDGYIYGLSLLAVAAVLAWATHGWVWAIDPRAAGGIFPLVFPRSRNAEFLQGEGLIVSPGDGLGDGDGHNRHVRRGQGSASASFFSVFDVHVNRSPISGVLTAVRYQKGQYLNAMNPASADRNEQNIVTVRGERTSRLRSSRLPGCWRGASSSTFAKAIRWSAGSGWG